jgi:transcriptional regulator with XRE-family HTH domain
MSKPTNKTQVQQNALQELGSKIREYRKRMKISSLAAAEASEISRITLYRIELGEASVTMGAYINVIYSLGLKLELRDTINTAKSSKKKSTQLIPKNIKIADYKQLKKLAWQLKGTKELSAEEALNLYERNWRHIDLKNLDKREEKLIRALMNAFGRERLLV